MRVDFTTPGLEPPEKGTSGRAGRTESSGPETGTGAGGALGTDQTRFSFDQKRVQSLEEHVLGQPEIREAKVQSLRQTISKGEYSVPASLVAEALVTELGGITG